MDTQFSQIRDQINMVTIRIEKIFSANTHQISSPGPIPGYITKISHILTHFYAPTEPTRLPLLKGHCVFEYVIPAYACLRGHLPIRVTTGHHANRVRRNNHAERVRFYQRVSGQECCGIVWSLGILILTSVNFLLLLSVEVSNYAECVYQNNFYLKKIKWKALCQYIPLLLKRWWNKIIWSIHWFSIHTWIIMLIISLNLINFAWQVTPASLPYRFALYFVPIRYQYMSSMFILMFPGASFT